MIDTSIAVLPRTKPRALRPGVPGTESGSTFAILSPASAAKPDRVHAGIAHLHRLGYRTLLGPNALTQGPLYYAGTLDQRLRDLHAAFANPEVDAILCTRGGWGSAELLPHLDRDLIRANPKAFLGYSDHTSLHTWLANEAGLVTFYAPMVSPDFSEPDGINLHSWTSALTGSETWSLYPEHQGRPSLRTLRPGTATGTFHGGCLAILVESLGTPFAPRHHAGILFLEDVNVRPFQWDRMLLHLRLAGQIEGVTGILFGDMQQCIPPAERSDPHPEQQLLEAAILHALRDFPGPIAIGLRSGHVTGSNITLPLGIQARLDCSEPTNPQIHFLEAATTP